MPPISVLMKPSSGMCNMTCDYCFYCDEAQKRKQESYGFMTEETLKNIIRKTMLRAEGNITYAYQGGEPTLRGLDFFKKAILLQKQYNKNGIMVNNALQTNGYCLDDEWCRFFSDNHFLIGVSVDGIKEIHDTYRHDKAGNGTYERVMHSIDLLDKYGVEYNILTVVNGPVAKNVAEIYDFYRKKGWRFQQYIACLDPLDEEKGRTGYALNPMQYGQFLTELFDMWYADWKQGKQPYIRQFENYIGIIAGYMPEACDQRGVCGMQHVIEADGSVYPCDFYMLDEFRLGNLNEVRLDEIEKRRAEIGFIEESRKQSSQCRTCKYFWICRGGCKRNRDFDKDNDTYHNYFCEGYKMFFDSCLQRMQEIAGSIGKIKMVNKD